MEESDKIYYVLTPDTPSLKIMKQYEELSERLGLVLTSRMEIALNKLSKDYEVKQKDLKNVLRYPIIASIRQDTKGLQSFINQGEPVRKTSEGAETDSVCKGYPEICPTSRKAVGGGEG